MRSKQHEGPEPMLRAFVRERKFWCFLVRKPGAVRSIQTAAAETIRTVIACLAPNAEISPLITECVNDFVLISHA